MEVVFVLFLLPKLALSKMTPPPPHTHTLTNAQFWQLSAPYKTQVLKKIHQIYATSTKSIYKIQTYKKEGPNQFEQGLRHGPSSTPGVDNALCIIV